MSAFLLDIDLDFQNLIKSTKEFAKNLDDIDKVQKSFVGLESSLGKNVTQLKAFGKVFGSFSAAALPLLGIVTTFESLGDVLKEGITLTKDLTGYAQGLTFSEAISGSKQLADNLEFLKNSKNDIANLGLVINSIFDPGSVTQWAAQSAGSFAKVEESAYRLSTVTVQGNERSIDSLDKSIKSMRELQKATNFAVDSVSLLNTQYDIASAGFVSKKDINNVGKASINLSQAGFGDVGQSTQAIVKVLRALGEESGNAETRAAQLFQTTKVGLLNLNQLTGEIGTLSVQSKSLGVSFEETNAALAGLTIKGVSASEAGTKISALFSEIAAGSEEANKYLSNFRDSAGKPIQINASALREKGLKGITDDLKTATQGNVSALQKIFSTKEAQEAAQLLISLGDDFTTFTDKIKNASEDSLTSEAENRAKTLVGAYTKALNESQKGVEEFGQGLAPEALENIIGANKLVSSLATTSLESTGKLVGTITGIADKAKAIGGFLASAFSVVAPLALFRFVFSNAEHLILKFKDFKKEGETVWDVFQRVSQTAFDFVQTKFDALIRYIVKSIKEINEQSLTVKVESQNSSTKKETNQNQNQKEKSAEPIKQKAVAVEEEFNPVTRGNFSKYEGQTLDLTPTPEVTPKQQSRFGSFINNVRTKASDFGKKASDFGNQDVKDVYKNIQSSASDKVGGIISGVKDFGSGISSVASKSTRAVGSVINTLKPVGSFIGGVGKEAFTMLAGIGTVGLAAGAALSITSGWFDTMGKVLNRSTIPELQDMRESLKDLENVPGLKEILDKLDPIAKTAKSAAEEFNGLEGFIAAFAGAWNTLTGQATQYSIIQEEIGNAQDKIKASVSSNISSAGKGVFDAKSEKGKVAEEKLNKGIILNADDNNALELEQRQRVAEVDANIALQRQKIAAFQAKGDGNEDTLAKLKQELQTLQDQSKEQKKQLELQLKQIQLKNAVNKLENISTVIPLSIQINSNREQSIKNQIDDITDTFKKGLDGALKSPEQFDNLKSKVNDTFKAIQIQAELDPDSAARLKKQLEQTLGKDYNRLLLANPEVQETARATNKVITESTSRKSQQTLGSRVSVLDAVDSLGSNATALALVKYKANIDALNEQAKALQEELTKPETTIARQIELTAQLEDIESKRVGLNADIAIKSELTARKQNLSLAQELFNLEQAKINLYSQENKFNLFTVAASQAKLDAAEAELKTKKESLAITDREEEIKKKTIVDSLNSKVTRDSASINAVFGTSNKSPDAIKEENTNKAKGEIDRIKTEGNTAKGITDEALKTQLQSIADKRDTFEGSQNSSEDRKSIVDAVREIALYKPQEQKGLEDIIGKEGFDKILKGNDNEKKSVLFEGNKLKNADKLRAFLNDNSRGNYDTQFGEAITSRLGLGSTGGTISKGTEALNKKYDTAYDEKVAAIKKAKSEDTKQDKETETNVKKTNTDTDVANQRIDVFSQLKTQTQSIIGAIGGSISKTISNVVDSVADNNSKQTKTKATSAQQDLIDTKTINGIKELVNNFDSVIRVSIAKIENEYAVREKLIRQGEILADSLEKVGSNTEIFGSGVTAANLALISFQAAKPNQRLDKDAAQANAQIDSVQSQRSDLVDKLNDKLSDAVSRGVSPDKIKQLSESRDKAVKDRDKGAQESVLDKQTVEQQTQLGKLNNSLKESELAIKKEYAGRELLLTNATEVTDSLSTFSSGLGSALNSILPNNTTAAKLNTTTIIAKTTTEQEKRGLDSDKQNKLLDARLAASENLVNVARKSGVSGDTLKSLEQNSQDTRKEVSIEKEITAQKNTILNANDKLTIFSAKLAESNTAIQGQIDIATRQAQVVKDSLDLQQRRKDIAGESNRSGTGLQSAFVGFLSKNNPFAALVQQRLDVRQNEDDATLAKSKNVTEAKKEIIDDTLQKAQIDLEQQSYANALSQTAILSDVLTTLEGSKGTASSSSIIQEAVKAIPDSIEKAKVIGQARSSLLDDKLKFIPEELKQKNNNIDRDTISKNLNLLGGNLLPGNIDLITNNIDKGQNNISKFNRQSVSTGSLDDPDFKSTLDRLNALTGGVSSVSNLITGSNKPNFNNNPTNKSTPSINAPVSINISVPAGTSGMDSNNFQSELKTYVGKQIDTGLSKLASNVLTAITS